MEYKIWSDKDVDFLIINYNIMTNPNIAKHLERTIGSVERKANSLKLTKSKEFISEVNRKTSDKDIKFLKDNYGILTAKEIALYIGKTLGVVEGMIRYYNLTKTTKPKSVAKTKTIWTEEDIDFLTNNFISMQQKDIAVMLNKTLSAIQKKMNYLGLLKNIRNDNWSINHIEYLKKHYKNSKMSILKSKLNRSTSSIRRKACELELSRDVSTYIETEVEEILKDLKVLYEPQYNIRGFIADFKIGENKVIEVHGDYWHCNPKLYHEPKTEAQIKNVQRDKVKHVVFKEEGYEILYVWEKDINSNYDQCVNLIEEYCRLETKLQKSQDD